MILYVCLCCVTPDENSRQALNGTNSFVIFDRLLESVIFIENQAGSNFSLLVCIIVAHQITQIL